MRLEDWQKWLDSQFITAEPENESVAPDTDPVAEVAQEMPASPQAATEGARAGVVAPAPPSASPYSGVEVAAAAQPAAAIESQIGYTAAVQSAAPQPPAPVATRFPVLPNEPPTPERARERSIHVDEVEMPVIESYMPFLRGREPQAPAKPPPDSVAAVESRSAISDATVPDGGAPESETDATARAEAGAAPQADVARLFRAGSTDGAAVEAEAASADVAPPEPTTSAAAEAAPGGSAPGAQTDAEGVGLTDEETDSIAPRRFGIAYRRARHARPVRPTDAGPALEEGALWSLVPRHIQSLIALGTDEVAQNSYKRSFRESRIELISRLLDPTLSLEETARLLNVCPTTVRRYTNKGMLTHQRTAGDQRRFRLSDVLAFMEAQSRDTGEAARG